MTRPLTPDERDTLIDRIAERIAAFDDASLEELDRVTDEASYVGEGPATLGMDGALDPELGAEPGRWLEGDVAAAGPDAPEGASLSRRQLLGGGLVLVLASLGTALAVRGAWPGAGCP